ncbi:hypothetical protein [Corynebacterium lehmanniae]|uniref:Secreted protein n=1 Tax=Corynebacterium lehmanniae TaxID=2913497 RepID=A0ABT4R7V9_9CORY|nr:hypothetical protein [Corynebacterium lehmanniae]MCZ9291463.1 hypothetical protein [Corynebacterium lehmanniae]
MNNQGSSQWNPDQTYSTDPDIGQTQQFGAVTQQQYGQPDEYAPSYQQPEKRGGPSPWLYVLGALLLAALVGVLAFMGGSGAFNRSSEPVTSTVVETRTLPKSEAPAPDKPGNEPAKRTYSHYAPDTEVTTAGFAANVYGAFQDSYGRTGTPDMTVSVYSPATKITYRMTCSGGETVYCTGGNNARVKIW